MQYGRIGPGSATAETRRIVRKPGEPELVFYNDADLRQSKLAKQQATIKLVCYMISIMVALGLAWASFKAAPLVTGGNAIVISNLGWISILIAVCLGYRALK